MPSTNIADGVVLYNGILRGLGICGEVLKGAEFWSQDFDMQLKARTIPHRVELAGHRNSLALFLSRRACIAILRPVPARSCQQI